MRAALGISNVEHTSSKTLLELLGQISMFELSLRTIAMEAWNSFADNGNWNREYITERLPVKQEKYQTRSSTMGDKVCDNFLTPLTTLTKLWNILPQEIRKETNLMRAK